MKHEIYVLRVAHFEYKRESLEYRLFSFFADGKRPIIFEKRRYSRRNFPLTFEVVSAFNVKWKLDFIFYKSSERRLRFCLFKEWEKI